MNIFHIEKHDLNKGHFRGREDYVCFSCIAHGNIRIERVWCVFVCVCQIECASVITAACMLIVFGIACS